LGFPKLDRTHAMTSDLKHRLGGVLSLAIGLATTWWGVLLPLAAARAHAPEVSYNSKAFVLAPLAIVFGLFFLLVGDKVPYRRPEAQNLTTAGWILMAVVAVASAASFFLLQQQFSALGYQPG
jgi:hypothetical protein